MASSGSSPPRGTATAAISAAKAEPASIADPDHDPVFNVGAGVRLLGAGMPPSRGSRYASAAAVPAATSWLATERRMRRWVSECDVMMSVEGQRRRIYEDHIYKTSRAHYRRVLLTRAFYRFTQRCHLLKSLNRVEAVRALVCLRQRVAGWRHETVTCRAAMKAAVVELRRWALRRSHARRVLGALELSTLKRLARWRLRRWYFIAQEDNMVRDTAAALRRAKVKRLFKAWLWHVRFLQREKRARELFRAILLRAAMRSWLAMPSAKDREMTPEERRLRRERLLRQQFHSVWRGTSLDVLVGHWPYRRAMRAWRDAVLHFRIDSAMHVVVHAWTVGQRAAYRRQMFDRWFKYAAAQRPPRLSPTRRLGSARSTRSSRSGRGTSARSAASMKSAASTRRATSSGASSATSKTRSSAKAGATRGASVGQATVSNSGSSRTRALSRRSGARSVAGSATRLSQEGELSARLAEAFAILNKAGVASP